jgi:hypothetical protein
MRESFLLRSNNVMNSFTALWEERRILYEQCMDLQLFYRDTEQADTWMAQTGSFPRQRRSRRFVRFGGGFDQKARRL